MARDRSLRTDKFRFYKKDRGYPLYDGKRFGDYAALTYYKKVRKKKNKDRLLMARGYFCCTWDESCCIYKLFKLDKNGNIEVTLDDIFD